MTSAPTPTAIDLDRSLVPVRDALLTDARAEAERLIAAARRDADEIVAAAEAEVAEQVATARRRAARTEQAGAEREMARARAAAHAALLTAERDLRQRWIDRVHERLPELRSDDRYPVLLARLEALARTQLGADARIEREPDGGFVALAAGRRVDYRLGALATRAIDGLAEEATGSWS